MPNAFDARELMAAARAVREHSYSPYSAFAVGAALLCEDGSVFAGCNVENAAYPLTICAEKAALGAAVSQGKRRFSAIAIAGPSDTATPPCGGCRQMLAEFAPALPVLYSNGEDSYETTSLEKLLPAQFELP